MPDREDVIAAALDVNSKRLFETNAENVVRENERALAADERLLEGSRRKLEKAILARKEAEAYLAVVLAQRAAPHVEAPAPEVLP